MNDVSSPQEVVAALQEALDEVLNPVLLARMISGEHYRQAYQYVRPAPDAPAVVTVSMIVDGPCCQQPTSTLLVVIKRLGNDNVRQSAEYVPYRLVERLRILLTGLDVSQTQIFVFDWVKNEARIRLSLPTKTFQQHPRAIVRMAS